MGYRSEIGIGNIATAITPSDSTNIAPGRQIYVGTGGDLNVTPSGQSTPVIHRNVPSGTFFFGSVTRIGATNTTASNIVVWQ